MTTEPTLTSLPRAFFERHATVVGPDLLGALLVRDDEGLVARIVEVEAYDQDDPACHAHRGRTARNDPLWGQAGHAYVYFTYGMHWCFNVATGPSGHAQGCLIRAAEPLEGLALMQDRRGDRALRELLRGPARLAQAFGIDGAWSGRDLCDKAALRLVGDGARPSVQATARTGVRAGADLPWRFVVAGSPWVSAYRRHPSAG